MNMAGMEEENKPENGPEETARKWPGEHVLSLDLRSLALLRVCYGVLLLCDILVRWTDLKVFYSDHGVLPRTDLLELGWNQHWFSLHMGSGNLIWLNLLFIVQGVAAVAVVLGWRTRLATFLSWLLLISIHSRNPMVLNGGDIYLRVVLFWMLFLPWGHRWSLDARSGGGDLARWMPKVAGNGVRGVAPLGVLVQIASVYWFAAIPKSDPSWTVSYSATSLALRLDQFVTPLGYFVRDNLSGQLALLTLIVIFWEFYGPFLFFFPFDRGQVRTFAVFGFVAMHVGFGTAMKLGLFAWIGAASVLCLIPAWFWDRIAGRFSRWADEKLGAGGPVEPVRWFTYPRELFFLLLMLYCFAWNCENEKVKLKFYVPKELKWIGNATRLDQRWNMFSPGPLTEDGWYVIEGRFKHGLVLDIFPEGGAPLTFEKPDDVSSTYKNQRWRKYMMNLWMAENQKYRLPFGKWICRTWNWRGRQPDELTGFDIYYMLETTHPDGSEGKPEKRSIWNHWCFEKPNQVENKSAQPKPPAGTKVEARPLRQAPKGTD